jgi:translation initiation factor eIF-2B subunit epsilon
MGSRFLTLKSNSHLLSSAETFENRASLQLRYDLLDCHIDICAPTVLQLFHAEFDYRDLRADFIRGVLNVSELVELQNAIHIHVTSDNEYAVRVRDLPTYASVSVDVLHRWYAQLLVAMIFFLLLV